jgi:hypothetical protein
VSLGRPVKIAKTAILQLQKLSKDLDKNKVQRHSDIFLILLEFATQIF